MELFFRELKSRYRAEDIPSHKPVIVATLLYAVILTVAVSRALLATVRIKLGDRGDRIPEERWATLFACVARDLLKIVIRPTRATRALERSVGQTLCHEAVDPNRDRRRLRPRVEHGVQLDYMFRRRSHSEAHR